MLVGQCVSAVRAVEVRVLVRLHSVYNHLTGRRDVRFVRLALKVIMHTDRDFMDVILLWWNLVLRVV